MSPDIGAVEINKDCDVAHDANGALRTVSSKRLPLFVEKKLQGAADIQLVEHLGVSLLHGYRIAMREFTGPAVPAFQLETRAQTVEENKVIEPPAILATEVVVARSRVGRSRIQEFARRLEQQG